ncbi:MAG: pilus assembly protein [Sphingomonas sp.]|uniref:TadE/TadG family type IV pilus assembly protein n=1 Tax=Sphingomonas sp. TaxID=28214 RepID=UPI001AD048E3|nr:TadE/TadG family type IV pilus assembly protein [Sphingomonas sp.]MBN8807359.1 pilus assembly protein [Sphingomonas sp.]
MPAQTRGSAAIQFAMVAAPFFALLIAGLEVSLVYFVQEGLETSVEAAARSVITGSAQKADSTGASTGMTQAQLQARFKQNACNALPAFMQCSNLYVDVRSAGSFSSLDTSMPTFTFGSNGQVTNTFSYNLGASGSIVLIRLMYIWPVRTAPLGFDISNLSNGQRLVVATSVAKIENY